MGAQPLTLAGFVDLFVHTVRAGLPHTYSERLARQRSDTAPRHLKRAERICGLDGQPIRLVDIALAAGCSARSLQIAVRGFRDTTPHAALRGIRLELSRAELLTGEDAVRVWRAGMGSAT